MTLTEEKGNFAMDTRMRDMFEKRGIDPLSDIVGARPYTPYRAGDLDALYAEDPKYRDELTPGQRGFMTRVINQRDGVIMRRHACLPGMPEPWAQIRPHRDGDDDPGVLVQTFRHRHPWAYMHVHLEDHEQRRAPSTRREGTTLRSIPGRARLLEHERHHPGPPDVVPAELQRWASEMHPHFWDWTAHLETSDYADQHAPDVKGWHKHQDHARYLYAPGDPERPGSGKERSAGIDVHPLAEELIDRGGARVYYAIEGVLKNDAMLAKGVPVFNTGSVTLWLPDELREFATTRLLGRFEQVVVVPDSDWHSNRQVRRQTMRIANLLAKYLDVEIAAPPAKCGTVCEHKDRATRRAHKNGIDDFLGPEEGGTVQQMIALHVDKERAHEAIVSKRRVARLIEAATDWCDPRGDVYASLDELADATGTSRDTVRRAIADAEAEGLVKYTEPDTEVQGDYAVGTLTLRRDLRPRHEFVELGD
jgi:hypothetical protein